MIHMMIVLATSMAVISHPGLMGIGLLSPNRMMPLSMNPKARWPAETCTISI